VCSSDLTEWYPEDYLLFKIAVVGPSDQIFIWWGHAALIVENTRWNFSRVYDWGIFTFPSDKFLKDFILEKVSYKCTMGPFDLEAYINEDRDVTLYTLNLDRKAKQTILAYADNNVMPENCYYDYHEFRENCATRIRDIIDLGTGGQLKTAFGNAPGRFSIRQHVLRYTWFRPFSDWFLSFMMGQNFDEKITVWDEMFLPVEIARNIADFTYTDDSGVEHKLVSSAQLINTSKKRPPILNEPLTTWPFALVAGLIAASLFFFIKNLRKKHPRTARILWGLSQSLLGLLFGGSGCVLVFGVFFMNNDYFRQNINLLFVNPLLLVITPLGIMAALNKPFRINPEKCLRVIWTYVFIACGITVILRALPFFFQQNRSVQGIILPVAFALSYIPDKAYKIRDWGQIIAVRNLIGSRRITPDHAGHLTQICVKFLTFYS
jgi:hypothetical protein